MSIRNSELYEWEHLHDTIEILRKKYSSDEIMGVIITQLERGNE